MGNNINGILHWNQILTKHEDTIRTALTFREKYKLNANKKLNHIKKAVLKPNQSRERRNTKKNERIREKIPTIIYVGIHVRYLFDAKVSSHFYDVIILSWIDWQLLQKIQNLESYFRKTDSQDGFIRRYNLPELKPSYFLAAMDEYHKHFAKTDPTAKVYFMSR